MKLAPPALDQLFLEARTASAFDGRPVPEALLREVYDLARMGPTSMNIQPARYVFLTTPQARERLLPALSAGNVDKSRAAPVTVIVASDSRFYEHMPQIWHRPGARERFEADPAGTLVHADHNSWLGAAYFMLAARALGLDCGPMGGFDAQQVNAEFLADGRWQAELLINLGYADRSQQPPRNPRLDFEQACRLL